MLRCNLRPRLSLLIFGILSSFCASSQIVVTQESNATILAQRLVGEGIIISNATYTGSHSAAGIFFNSNTNLLIDSGIVLGTGDVLEIPGGAFTNASSSLGVPGDVDLASLIHGHLTRDASILEFDFIPLGDTIRFRYVFASEEYNEYVCTKFNDVFGFFISGPGFPTPKNIALVPGTSIPVAINSVNSGVPGSVGGVLDTCLNMGAGSPFTQYFIDNTSSIEITCDGLTTVLTATALVTPCQTYHLKLAIADADDSNFDSDVFLEAKSLSASAITIDGNLVPTDNNVSYVAEGCNQGQVRIKRAHVTSSPLPITLFFGGTATNGVDVTTIPSTAIIPANDSDVIITVTPLIDNITEGIETLKIYVAPGCSNGTATDSISIEIRDFDTLNVLPKDSAYMCKNGTVQLQATGGYTTWSWSPAASLNLPSSPSPIASPSSDTYYVCTADFSNCHARDSVLVKFKRLKLRLKRDTPCFNEGRGQIVISGDNWVRPLQFSINNGPFGSDSSFNNLYAGSYLMTIKDATGCTDTLTVNIAQTYPDLAVNEVIITASCTGANGQITLTGTGGLAPYFYSVDGTNYSAGNVFFPVNGGNDTVFVQDYNGCKTPKPIVIANDPPINIVIAGVTDATCSGLPDGTITVNASGGSGNYTYSSGGAFQPGNVLNVPGAAVTVTVIDNKGCTSQQPVTVPLNNFISIDAGAPKTICEGDHFSLEGISNTDTITWSPSTGVDGIHQLNSNAHPTDTIMYYLNAVSGICTRKDSVIITVRPAPIPDAGDPFGICYGGTTQLHGSGGVEYNWHPTDYMTYADSSAPTIRPLEDMTYYLAVTDIYGCHSLFEDYVNVNTVPAVKIYAGPDTVVAVNQPLIMHGDDVNVSGVTQWVWTPAYALDDSHSQNTIARLDVDTTYILTGTTPEGCEGSDTIHIRVYVGPDLYVASVFTPDNNGVNDVLHVKAIGIDKFRYFRLYNRWGQVVFETHDRNSGWNGKIKGSNAPSGTYVWIAEGIDYLGRLLNKKGMVVLIR